MFKFFTWLFHRKPKEKQIKLGLALGSGGAKGFAELGALKAFEENGLTFDYIAGTSIGSIIGAFYANGNTSDEILELIKEVDISEIKTLFMINMDTSKVFDIIDRTIGSLNIEDLKKPFVAIGTDLESGEEEVFKSGNTAMALCASSSYPPFFKPVAVNGRKYVDGAFTNSIPSDKVREMGADVVIGIDLANHNAKSNFLLRIIPTYQGKVKEPWKKGYDNSDIVLHPDLSKFTPIAINEGQKMYDIGYQEAIAQMPKILNIIKEKKTNEKTKKNRHTHNK